MYKKNFFKDSNCMSMNGTNYLPCKTGSFLESMQIWSETDFIEFFLPFIRHMDNINLMKPYNVLCYKGSKWESPKNRAVMPFVA